jgi:hypothetical protein
MIEQNDILGTKQIDALDISGTSRLVLKISNC